MQDSPVDLAGQLSVLAECPGSRGLDGDLGVGEDVGVGVVVKVRVKDPKRWVADYHWEKRETQRLNALELEGKVERLRLRVGAQRVIIEGLMADIRELKEERDGNR